MLTSSYADAHESSVEFAAEGRLAAQDPCGNAVEGTYRITGDEIRFSNVVASLIGCPPELTLDVALFYTRSARIDGFTLMLLDAAGVPVVEATFTSATPAPSPKPAVTSTPPWTPEVLTPPASPNRPS